MFIYTIIKIQVPGSGMSGRTGIKLGQFQMEKLYAGYREVF